MKHWPDGVARVCCVQCEREFDTRGFTRHQRTHEPGGAMWPSLDERARMVELYRRGQSMSQIATATFYCYSTVRRVLCDEDVNVRPRGGRHGKRRLSSEQVLETTQLYARGVTMRELAQLLGVSQTAVWKRLHVYGAVVRPRSYRQRERSA